MGQAHQVHVSSPTYKNLEIFQTLDGQTEGSLWWVMNKTVTASGRRLLKQRMNNLTHHKEVLEQRLCALRFFAQYEELSDEMRLVLRSVGDIERSLVRLSNTPSPLDLGVVRQGLSCFKRIDHLLQKHVF